MMMHRSMISHVFSRYQETGSYSQESIQCRPRVTTNRENCIIVNEALRFSTRVVRQIKDAALLGKQITTQTIRKRFHERE